MKNFFKQGKSTATGAQAIDELECRKLYVAYLNEALIKDSGKANDNHENSIRDGKPSVFSTTGGSYYINGVPAILSQDEEAMLYENEYSEYY
jgi:hypothetical protein